MKRLLKSLYKIWLAFGLLLGRLMNPMILTIVYAAVMLPTALIMKCCGKDPMRRRFDPAARTYWLPHTTTSSMKDTF